MLCGASEHPLVPSEDIISNSQSGESRGKFKVTGGLQRRVSGMARFEQFWEVSCEIVKSQMGDLKNRYIRDTFKLMCLNELSILEQNDRQHGFRTPSKPLKGPPWVAQIPPTVDQDMWGFLFLD